jgi:hypothetical protein
MADISVLGTFHEERIRSNGQVHGGFELSLSKKGQWAPIPYDH